MLHIYFGDIPETEEVQYIYDTATFFNNTYKDKWILTDFAKEVIRDVDKSKVIDAQNIASPVLGTIGPTKLSGGVKTLLLIANTQNYGGKALIFNASQCGDNCAKWLLRIAEDKEKSHKKVVINLRHLMDFGNGSFRIKILNTNTEVKNMTELVWNAGDFV